MCLMNDTFELPGIFTTYISLPYVYVLVCISMLVSICVRVHVFSVRGVSVYVRECIHMYVECLYMVCMYVRECVCVCTYV